MSTVNAAVRNGALAVGVAMLAAAICGPSLADNTLHAGIAQGPTVVHDLAAVDLVSSIDHINEKKGTARMVMIGTCKNVGSIAYTPGDRLLRIQRKNGNKWATVASAPVPALQKGETFSVRFHPKAQTDSQFRVKVTRGSTPDDNPADDTFMPMPSAPPNPR